MDDLISRQAAIEIIQSMYSGMPRIPWMRKYWQERYESYIRTENAIRELPSAQPQYEELTPEEAASEIASGSIMSARYWLDAMIRLKQMGYAICRKK